MPHAAIHNGKTTSKSHWGLAHNHAQRKMFVPVWFEDFKFIPLFKSRKPIFKCFISPNKNIMYDRNVSNWSNF